jgi:hypothetical protein
MSALYHDKPTLKQDLGIMPISEGSKHKKRFGLYVCGICGSEFKAISGNVNSGKTTSCGCFRLSQLRKKITKHGDSNTRLFSIWKGIKKRCYYKKDKFYHRYGGLGIKVCDEWVSDYSEFKRWALSNGYSDELTIERIDVSGNYEPVNCTWIAMADQSYNKRIHSNNTSGYKGVSYYKKNKKYIAYITYQSKRVHIGYYETALEAAMAYNKYIKDNNLPHSLNKV